MASSTEAGVEALLRLQAKDPVPWLTRDPSLAQTARVASQYLFSFLRPFSKKSPLDELLVDGFDDEQIWKQIDLQSQPLLPTLRQRLKQLEESPEEISKIKDALEGKRKVARKTKEEWHEESDGFDEELDEFDDDDDEECGEEEGKVGEKRGKAVAEDEENEEEEEEEEKGLESEEEEEEEAGDYGGIQDDFLKMKDLEKFLVQEENNLENDDAGQLKEVDDESDEAGEFGLGNDDVDEFEDSEYFKYAIYEDFFPKRKKSRFRHEKERKEKRSKLKERLIRGSEGSDEDEMEIDGQVKQKERSTQRPEDSDEDDMEFDGQVKHKERSTQGPEDSDEDDMEFDGQNQEAISTHEKQVQKIQAKIEQMEKSNLEPKTWTMQGEVTATKRPMNSALEVDLDFEQNMRPAPVITEEITASIEEMIQKRIVEGRFDDVLRAPRLPSKAPREVKELDENKSKKGLAEIYEEEFIQKTDPASAPLSFKDEQKNEASMLFKRLCLKLDALSHFNFAPKPVIEDMSIQANVPALAMEEIAPVAVSDAAMLAPEEVFASKGDIKEEAELTKADRKRRRANKKRKFKAKAMKKMATNAQDNTTSQTDG